MGRIVAQGVDELLGRVAACAHLFCIDGVALEGFVGADDVFAVHEGFAGFYFHAASGEDGEEHEVGLEEIGREICRAIDHFELLQFGMLALDFAHSLAYDVQVDADGGQYVVYEPEYALHVGCYVAAEEEAHGFGGCLRGRGVLRAGGFVGYGDGGDEVGFAPVDFLKFPAVALVEADDFVGILAGVGIVVPDALEEEPPEGHPAGEVGFVVDAFDVVEMGDDGAFVAGFFEFLGQQAIDGRVDEDEVVAGGNAEYFFDFAGGEAVPVVEGCEEGAAQFVPQGVRLAFGVDIVGIHVVGSQHG